MMAYYWLIVKHELRFFLTHLPFDEEYSTANNYKDCDDT